MLKRVAALDIGGAHIKRCGPDGKCATLPFALWRHPDKLREQLEATLRPLGAIDMLGVTMTGELCDCFATKSEGVRHIIASVEQAVHGVDGARRTRIKVWRTDGVWAEPDQATADPLPCAAANWHALATFAAARIAPASALLIDVGSTTTDIIPLVGAQCTAQGHTDTERLCAGELVYTGIRRTPIAAVVRHLPYRGRSCPVAAEAFATTQDAYVLLGELPESAETTNTADGQPLTATCARTRMARMVCADRDTFDENDALAAARHVAASQQRHIVEAASRVLAQLRRSPDFAVIVGSGESVARNAAAALHLRPRPLVDRSHHHVSDAATAFALQSLVKSSAT